MINELTITCNCHDKEQQSLAAHLVNGVIPILIIKCEICLAAYAIMPNTVQNA